MKRLLTLALLAVVACQLAFAFLWVRPGPLNIDEVIYQWMTRSAAEGRPLVIQNGYEELPSDELTTVRFMRTRGDRLTGQYPLLFTVLAAPFYAFVGFRGLFLVNALAFAGVLAFTYRIGCRLLGDRFLAVLGCGILAGCTFAWEYSMAAWPHMATLLLLLAAFDQLLVAMGTGGAGSTETGGAGDRAAESGERGAGPDGVRGADAGGNGARRGSFAAAIRAGLLLGIAVGFRRDAFFFLPVLAVPLVYLRPPRLWALGGLALGAAPPLALIGWLNWMRWGLWSPLSYGRPEPRYRVLIVAGGAALGAVVLLASPGVRAFLRRHARSVVLGTAVLVLAAVLAPATRGRMLRIVDGTESLLLDLRGAPTELAGMSEVYYWGVLYAGGVKKALLQSLPWLPLVALALVGAYRDVGRRRALALLLLPVAVTLGVHVFFNRHGGMGLNLRYYLPALPFLALLGAMALGWAGRAGGPSGPEEAETSGRSDFRGLGRGVLTGVALSTAGWLFLRPSGFDDPGAAELPVLDAPLLLAALVTVGVAVRVFTPRGRRFLGVAAGAAFAWSAFLAFDYDARWSRKVRAENLERSRAVAEQVPPGSLFFGRFPDWHGSVPEFSEGVVVAFPRVDGFRDFRRLALHHLDRGRRVFAVLGPEEWEMLEQDGRVEGIRSEVVPGARAPLVELERSP